MLLTWILVFSSILNSCICFDFPSGVSSDIPSASTITASSTCTSSDTTCNSTCPTRTFMPFSLGLFTNIGSLCDSSIPSSPKKPSHVKATTGLQFTNETTMCTFYNVSNTLHTRFTLSVWLFANCSDCTILRFGSNATFRVVKGKLSIGQQGATVPRSSWTHLAIRFDGKLTWILNGNAFSTTVTSLENMIGFGPNKNLSDDETVAFVDAKTFAAPLTFREIEQLRTNTFSDIPVETDCRCPDNAPYLVENTLPEKYLKCRNFHSNVTVSRLNPDDHNAIFMLDKDQNTYWKSAQVDAVTLTLTLPKLYQLQSVALSGLETIPDRIIISLKHGTTVKSILTFVESCAQRNCKSYNADIQSYKRFSHNFENGVNLDTKSDADSIVADALEIKFESQSTNAFQVRELELDVRCHCYGNDKTCTINGTAYTCNCLSNTMGTHCDTCKNEYFVRDVRQLKCTSPCECHPGGRTTNVCNKIGGQCSCKNNTEGRTCSDCKHNTINIGSDFSSGCKTCSCNPEGIERCLPSGTCDCKPNVETASGTCTACKSDYYGISNSGGCRSCACDAKGTKPSTSCDKVTGQCSCKTHVQGRTCNECSDEYYKLTNANPNGCLDCRCNFIGANNKVCDKTTGQCSCLNGDITDRQCSPKIDSITPLYGPMAGGTRVTITGKLLWQTGVDFRYSIGDTQQKIILKNDSVIVVETKSSTEVKEEETTIAWYKGSLDHRAERSPQYRAFRYKTNPSITVKNTIFKTYASGGCRVDVTGEHFDSIYQPKLMVFDVSKAQNLQSMCHYMTNEHIECPMPNVTSFTTSGNLSYGIWLDNVLEFRDLASRDTFIEVLPDPAINVNQVTEFKNTFDQEIKIEGKDLNLACDDRDVRISIGQKGCTIKERTNSHIICHPHEEFPGSNRDEELVVYIGNIVVRQGIVKFKGFWTLPEFIAIAVSAGIVLLLIGVVSIYCLYVRRRQSENTEGSSGIEMRDEKYTALKKGGENAYDKLPRALKDLNAPKLSEDTFNIPDPVSEFIDRLDSSVGQDVRSSFVERTHIEPGQVCKNKGSKIRVINGQLTTSNGRPLTIKTLVSSYSDTGTLPSWLTNGLKESMRLQNCVNDNVLRMMGISIDNKNVYVLYPEMSNRTLKDYLTSAKQIFTNEQKLDLCVQALEGMVYLSSENIVHRDLAARNCWISSDGIVKVADGSFSFDLYPDEYLFQNGRHQPVRWMAPESLRQLGFYTSKTDVWSFGVLVWEVMTNGYLPYQDVTKNTQIKDYVCEQDYKLGRPHNCPDNVYSVIEHCQGDYGDQRPDFSELLQTFTNIISPDSGAGDHLYQNQNELRADQNHEEDGMEIYENAVVKPPPRKPKPKR